MNPFLRNLALGGALGLGVFGGGALAFAQTTTEPPPTTTTAPDATTGTTAPADTTTTAPSDPTTTEPGATPDSAPPSTATPGPAPDGSGRGERRAGRGGIGHVSAAELAQQLGKTEDEVKAARQAADDAVRAKLDALPEPDADRSTPPTDEEKAQREALRRELADTYLQTFASTLGVSVDQVKAAYLAVAKTHLDEAVADGRLTQEQADERYAELESGELPLGFGLGGRGPGGPGGHGRGGPGCDDQAPATGTDEGSGSAGGGSGDTTPGTTPGTQPQASSTPASSSRPAVAV